MDEEDRSVTRLKGDLRMSTLLREALWQRVRFPVGEDVLTVGTAGRQGSVSRAAAETQLHRLRQGNYSTGRSAFRAWVAKEVGSGVPPQQVDNAVDRVWPSLTAQAFLRELLASRERILSAAGESFTAGEAGRLVRTAAQRVSDEQWSDADVALLDEADWLISGQTRSFSHVVVDEAQDLSPMQLRSIRRRSSHGSMTVVGDLAQSTGEWARDSWDDLIAALQQDMPARVEELKLGYRVPEQVYALAAQLLPEAAPAVEPPRVIRRGPAHPDLREVDKEDRVKSTIAAAQDYAGKGLFVGIVCPDVLRGELAAGFKAAQVAWSDASQGALGKSINVVSPEDAKGLEFDAVIVMEPEEISASTERGLRLLYVAMTRTTRYLTVVYSGVLLPLATAPNTEDREPPMVESHQQPPDALVDVTYEATTSTADARGQGTLIDVGVQGSGPASQKSELRLDQESPSVGASEQPSGSTVAPPTGTTPPGPAGLAAANQMARRVSEAVAESLAESIRESVAPQLWPYVVSQLRHELGLSETEE